MAKQHYCFLERFNNYFNRKVIKYESLLDYQNKALNNFIPIDSEGNMTPFDFNPNDNITTEIIANNVPFDADYFLLLDDDAEIVSRWFILEQKRNRQGQWLYFLRRDVLADSYNEILAAPVYVEKGIINDLNSPLLLNNEDARVNQIKKKEYLLKDSTRISWLVAYLKKGALGNHSIGPNNNGKITIDVGQDDDIVDVTLATPITSWAYYQYVNSDYKVCNYNEFKIYYKLIIPPSATRLYVFGFKDNDDSYYTSLTTANSNLATYDIHADDELAEEFINQKATLKSQVLSEIGFNASSSTLMAYNGKIIKDSTGKCFKVKVYTSSQGNQNYKITTSDYPTLKSTMTSVWNTALGESDLPNDKSFEVNVNYTSLRITLEELPNFQTEIDFGEYTGKGTDSALYDVIFLPYGPCWIRKGGTTLSDQANKDRSMAIMTSITNQLTSQWVLDLQFIPYFPALELSYGANNIGFPNDPEDVALVAKHSGTVTDIIGVCKSMNYTLDLWVTGNGNPLIIEDNSDVPDTYKRKYVNDCTMVRLCSPNYNGIFEFNLAKNGGQIRRINVDITLRPYNPYIHANPDFSFLYGDDFNDQRGLICGGDFSLGIINDAWFSYEIQNKNYQAIFDRQIQNLDLNNAITRQEAGWQAFAGTIHGAGAGAVGGLMASGSPYGALAGAAIGGFASGAGGLMDIQNLEKRQTEQRNFAIDNYNLQLGTVRALPNSITKTSALTFNNKLFLFYEVYECSEEEKQAYYSKIKYNGMTVGKIDTMQNYISADNSNYFRAKLIRLLDISEDNHYVETINEELLKGVFI